MTCRNARTWITDAVEGSLDGARRAELERHTATCRRCSETLESHRRISALLSGEARASVAPVSVAGGVVAGLRPARRPARLAWRLVAAAGTLAAVAGALALVVYTHAPGLPVDRGYIARAPADVAWTATPISARLCIREHAQASFFYASADRASWSLAVTESNKTNLAW